MHEQRDLAAVDDSAEREAEATAAPVPSSSRRGKRIPGSAKAPPGIVGIGASAGGLEALRSLIRALPASARLSYVIAQHLSPSHRSMLVQLLTRETTLRVVEIKNGTRPKPNVIYVTPFRANVRYAEGRLVLSDPSTAVVPKPSVDEFFTSLADECADHAIGIVLSGTGSDGARGIRAIRAAGGLTFVQEPDSAKYDGMPRASIETGAVNHILTPEEIGKRLGTVGDLIVADLPPDLARAGSSALEEITAQVRAQVGIDLATYKESTLHRRLRRRMAATDKPTLESYARHLHETPAEARRLAEEMLISVTSFFRDSTAFDTLANSLEALLLAKSDREEFRVWVPGCATGEEAYSIAIILADLKARHNRHGNVRIFATDIDATALARARRGLFPLGAFADVPPQYREGYFTTAEGSIQIVKRVRDQLIFSAQNVIRDPVFLRIDLVSCRNVLIYMRPRVQDQLFRNFHFALNPRGLLFLGKAESAHVRSDLFAPVDEHARVYRRLEIAMRLPVKAATGSTYRVPAAPGPRAEAPERGAMPERLLRALQQRFVPPAVVVNDAMEVKLVLGDVSPFLHLPEGEMSVDIAKMAERGLRVDIRSLLLKAQREREQPASLLVNLRSLPTPVRLTAIRMPEDPAHAACTLLCFERVDAATLHHDAAGSEAGDGRVAALEDQLAATREHLQTVVQELETSNEELQSLNEELQSANEELMSSNEELETTNEELQSTNEELTTVNEELEAKTQELIALNTNLLNVKNSLAYPLIVVDEHRRIMLFNRRAVDLFDLSELSLGESLFSVPCRIEIGDLAQLVAIAIESGAAQERQLTAIGRDFHMRIEPYLDQAGAREGAVLTFVDNTEIMQADRRLIEYADRLREAERFSSSVLDALNHYICVIDAAGVIVRVNIGWQAFVKRAFPEVREWQCGGRFLAVWEQAAQTGDAGAEMVLAGLTEIIQGRRSHFIAEYHLRHAPDDTWFQIMVTRFSGDGPEYYVINLEDISAQKRQHMLMLLQSRALDRCVTGILIADARQGDYPVVYANRAFHEITGYDPEEIMGLNCRYLQGADHNQPGLEKIRAAMREGRVGRALLRNYRKDGSMFWNDLAIYPIEDEDGAAAYFVGIQRDVSAMIASEEALKLSIEREKLALAFADVGSFEWDVRSSMISNSDIHRKLLGLNEGRRDLPYAEYRMLIHSDDRPLFDDAVKLCLAGHDGLDLEYRIVRRDGSIHWMHTKGNAEADENGVARRVLCLSQNISARKEAEERVRFIAHHDALTGLPNRTLLRDRLQQAMNGAKRNRLRVAVLFIDLDRFKTINDSLGHQIGDLLLQAVARRLKRCVRETDTICRQSGDEFIVVLPAIRDSNEAGHVASKILETLSLPYEIEGYEVHVTPSIGVSIYPDDADSIDILIRNADSAMYHAKGGGRCLVEFFTPEMNAKLLERIDVTNSLRQSLERGELALFYQPEICVETGRIVCIEALVRWRHPERGLVLPDAFVPVAEDSDLIGLLGEWVLREACRQNRAWQDAGLPPVPIAVNVSPAQFRQKQILEKVVEVLHESGLEARYLELELTERAIMREPEAAQHLLESLHKLGVKLTVDDFGTGYSSLSYLHRFPIDKIKIDRSFVEALPRDAGAAAIVRSVINLAHSLKLELVAEGVETPEQLEFLRAERCSAYQGFLAVRPAPAGEVDMHLAGGVVLPHLD